MASVFGEFAGASIFDIADRHIVRVVRNQLPHGRVLNGNALHAHVLAVVEDDQLRTRVAGAENAVILDASRLLPPALSVAVDHAFAGDREIGGVGCADQRLQIGQVKHGQSLDSPRDRRNRAA
jgi:hypothetical protein